ncbi:MAG: FtsX-like permease family protein [Gammaproteobacteria bacterium]|nr:FtsX-like permease family protein [Gammaproteobacteria bacterium]
MVTYLTRHLQVMLSALGAMQRNPAISLNTIIIVAVTLLLPLYLYIAVQSGQQLSDSWQGRPQISIFLETEVADREAALIYDEIRLHPAVELAELISPSQAMVEFRALSDLGEQLDLLPDNPLPFSIVAMPHSGHASREHLQRVEQELQKIDGIDAVRLDLAWTDRFNALLALVTQVATVLSALLVVGLIFIIGNTIRLLILNRRAEIEITKLVGATDSFVRRPFLYYGALFGLFGGLLCLALLGATALWLQPFIDQLAASYQGSARLYQLDMADIATIVLIAIAIGWLAARWSVARHLQQIRPN